MSGPGRPSPGAGVSALHRSRRGFQDPLAVSFPRARPFPPILRITSASLPPAFPPGRCGSRRWLRDPDVTSRSSVHEASVSSASTVRLASCAPTARPVSSGGSPVPAQFGAADAQAEHPVRQVEQCLVDLAGRCPGEVRLDQDHVRAVRCRDRPAQRAGVEKAARSPRTARSGSRPATASSHSMAAPAPASCCSNRPELPRKDPGKP
jgi:hypothetical protein